MWELKVGHALNSDRDLHARGRRVEQDRIRIARHSQCETKEWLAGATEQMKRSAEDSTYKQR